MHEFHLTRTVEESKAINKVNTPCIIVSASGMAAGGRVLHHLAQRLPDARNVVILAGFQAQGTRGRALQEGAKTSAIVWPGSAGQRRNRADGPTFRPRGKERIAAMAQRIAVGTETNLFDARRTCRRRSRLQKAIVEKFSWNVAVARYLDTVPIG